VFDILETARCFALRREQEAARLGRNDRFGVFLCECEGETRPMPPILWPYKLSRREIEAAGGYEWPANTRMFKCVKLTNRVA